MCEGENDAVNPSLIQPVIPAQAGIQERGERDEETVIVPLVKGG